MASSRSRNSRGMEILKALTKGSKKWQLELMGQKVTMYAVVMTPEIADDIIENCNLRNRTIRQNKVLEWASFMRTGEWQLRGEIAMTEHGEVIDGQHRILAVVEAGMEQPFFLRVIPVAKAFDFNRYSDIGVPRNIADYLHFNGVPDAPRTAPVLVYERNARISGNPLQATKGAKPEYLALFREIGEEAFKRAFDIVPRGLHTTIGVNRAFLDWFALHAQNVEKGAADVFLGLLADPSELKKTDAPWVLREALIDLQRRSQKVSLVQQAHMTLKAWRFFGEDQPTTPGKIRHRMNEDWPGIFGEEV